MVSEGQRLKTAGITCDRAAGAEYRPVGGILPRPPAEYRPVGGILPRPPAEYRPVGGILPRPPAEYRPVGGILFSVPGAEYADPTPRSRESNCYEWVRRAIDARLCFQHICALVSSTAQWLCKHLCEKWQKSVQTLVSSAAKRLRTLRPHAAVFGTFAVKRS